MQNPSPKCRIEMKDLQVTPTDDLGSAPKRCLANERCEYAIEEEENEKGKKY